MNLKETLWELQDNTYQAFQKRIIKNDDTIIGVRTPILRKLAKQLLKEHGIKAYTLVDGDCYEERLLRGMIVANAKMPFSERVPYIKQQVEIINNWALCDLFCSDLKQVKQHKQEMLESIKIYLNSEKEYAIRFGVVMLLMYYIEDKYCAFAFAAFDRIKTDKYYVQMAIAWAISIYYITCKQQTLAYLEKHQLDDFTYQKALQKIIESKQVSEKEKEMFRKIKKENRA